MSTINLATNLSATKADTSNSPNTVVMRDNLGGVNHVNVTTGSLTCNSVNETVSTKTSAYSLGITETNILCDGTSGIFTVTLPTVAGIAGRMYRIMKIDSAAHTITINCADSAVINGSTTLALASQYNKATLVTDGTNWFSF